jgi:hypothetical protein
MIVVLPFGSQVQDYLVALRGGDGEIVFGKMLVLLKVFITLEPKHEYVRSCSVSPEP